MNEPAAEWVDIGLLKAWDKNPRRNSGAVAPVAESIKRFGFANPILARRADGEVIAGHTRLLAAESLGLTKVPVRWMDLDPADAHLLAIADNKLGEIAEWDDVLLGQELSNFSFDEAALAGFDSVELEALGTSILEPEPVDAEPQIDRADELRKKWGVELGQIWVLGEHRLLCGDSAIESDVARVVGGRAVDCIVTDPPYSSGGRQDNGKRNSTSIGTRSSGTIARDNLTTKGYVALMARVLSSVDAETAYLFTDWRMWTWTFDALESSGYPVRNMLVWDKNRMGMGFPWRSQHELIAFAKKSGAEMMDGKSGNVLRCDRQPNDDHPTQKPVELMCEILRNNKCETVYEPFSGSGTTLLACEQLGMKCRAVEIDPGYVAVALQRWADATGKTPVMA